MAFHDLVRGTDFPVTKTGVWKPGAAEFAETAAFSRDGKQVAFQWFEGKTSRFEMRVTAVGGDAAPRPLFHSDEFRWVAPQDWSPDGKWIATGLEPENSDARTFDGIKPGQRAAVGLVGVQDGSLRLLKTADWLSQDSGFRNIRFSPDGKLLAYDRAPTDPKRWWQRHVFVLVIEDGREIPVAVHSTQEQLVGWSTDGSRLLFTSDRTGSIDLWSLAFVNGKPQGDAEMIRQGIGRIVPFNLNTAGGLYYCVSAARDVPIAKLATLDFSSGKLLSTPVDVTQADHGEASVSPDWSPDGKSFAFISRRQTGAGSVASIKVRSTDSGEVRELHPMLYAPHALRYTPDGRSLLIMQAGPMVHVDARTGDVSPVMKQEPGIRRDNPVLSLDGKFVYYVRQERASNADDFLVARDLASGSERELMRRRNMGGLILSPN
jgi:dipeptidyl aminopeptidase/acylaminoacyl peptidase